MDTKEIKLWIEKIKQTFTQQTANITDVLRTSADYLEQRERERRKRNGKSFFSFLLRSEDLDEI